MAIEDRIPEMTDKELAVLHDNAKRLALSGAVKQQTDAERLTPLIEAELAARKARAPVKAKAVRKTAAKKKEKA
jgi:hypothetical protein